MAEKGFAICCPHCAKRNRWPKTDPHAIAVGRAEFGEILTGLQRASKAGKPWEYTHKSLIRCTRPRWSCPSSFEAIVFSSRDEMKTCLQRIPKEWPFKRDFRLYRANLRGRWEGRYWAIMFCTPPFSRMRDIEFESMMDRELLSRLIAGMSVEIEASLTIFGANIFEPEGKETRVYWMPIEGYSREKRLTPPRFNKFCQRLRYIEMRKLVEEYETRNVNVDNCPIGFGKDGKCADREKPACMRKTVGDWCHCPAFMEERKARSACYSSDLDLIARVTMSDKEEAIENGIRHTCPAGFTELGFPIMVHDHLVAVVMIGQVFSEPEEIADVGELVSKYDILEGHDDDLEQAKQKLIQEEDELRKRTEPRFFMSVDEVRKRIALLRPNIERLTEMANARYRDIRRRSEAVFREELLEYFQKQKNEPDFFYRAVPHILKRMREFWAFRALYLVAYSYTSKDIRIIGMSSKSKGEKPFGLPGKKVGTADPPYRQTHPIRYLYCKSVPQEGLDPLVKDLLGIFDEVSQREEFSIDADDLTDANHLFVLVPFYNEVYAFIFSVRDEKSLCRLERPARGDVSELCQEIVLRVCTEVVYEFGDVWYREVKEKIKLEAWRSFSARTAHKISNRVFAARGALRRQKDVDPKFEGIKELESAIERIGQLCNDFIRFSTDQPLKVRPVDVGELISEEVALWRKAAEEKDARLDFEIAKSLTKCVWDPWQIREAITELLENAINYGRRGGRILIAAQHSNKDSVRTVKVTVYNEGPGVEQNNKAKVFEPFFSTRPERAGLGLFIVAKIVGNHKGEIHEIGEPGKNATFVAELPVNISKERKREL